MTTSLTFPGKPSMLPAALAPAMLAHLANESQVRELPFTELVPLVGDLLNGAALLLGHRNALADLDDLDLMATGVASMLRRRFGSFKPAELSEAFQRGASGEYRTDPTAVLTVSLPVVAGWVEGYQRTARAETIALLNQQQAQAAQLPPPRIDYVGSVEDYVALAKANELPTGFDLDLGNVLYTWLKEIGAFTGFRTAAQYASMQAEETDRLLTYTLPASGIERREYSTFVNALAKQEELPDSHPLSRSVVNACKKRVLREWLQYFAENERDIAAFLADPHSVCMCWRAVNHEVCPDCHDSGIKQLPQAA